MQPTSTPADTTPYAPLWQRFAAVTVDEAITLILFAPPLLLEMSGTTGAWVLGLYVAGAALRYGYFVFFEQGDGQTIGKRLLQIKVRSERQDRLPLKEALLRNLRRFDVLMGLALPEDLSTAGTVGRLLAALAIFYTAAAPIFIWLSVKKQRPLDMLAHTIVVRTEPVQPRPL